MFLLWYIQILTTTPNPKPTSAYVYFHDFFFFLHRGKKPSTSCCMVNNAFGCPSTKLYMVHEETCYILYESQDNFIEHGGPTGHNVTKIMFLWSDSDVMEFIADCHVHLFRVEASSNAWILGADWIGCASWNNLFIHDETSNFTQVIVFPVNHLHCVNYLLTRFEEYQFLPPGTGMHNTKHDIANRGRSNFYWILRLWLVEAQTAIIHHSFEPD